MPETFIVLFYFKPCRIARPKKNLLVSVPVLIAAIRAFPGNPVAGHPPLVFIHAGLADGESATAVPAEHERFPTAMALFRFLFSTVFFSFFSVLIHVTNILLL
jgi:hypothetical protein